MEKKRNPTSFSRSLHNLSRIPPAPPLNTQKSFSEVRRQCFEGHSLFLAVCDEGTTLRVRTIEKRQDTNGKTRNALQVVTLVNSAPPKFVGPTYYRSKRCLIDLIFLLSELPL